MSGLFGTGLYSRIKRWGYTVSQTIGPVTVHGETSLWALPWPSAGVYLEPGEVTVSLRLDGGMTDSLLAVSVTVRTPEWVTSLAHSVKDYEDEYVPG